MLYLEGMLTEVSSMLDILLALDDTHEVRNLVTLYDLPIIKASMLNIIS